MDYTAEQRKLLRQALGLLLDTRRHSYSGAFALVNSCNDNAERIITPEVFDIPAIERMIVSLQDAPCVN